MDLLVVLSIPLHSIDVSMLTWAHSSQYCNSSYAVNHDPTAKGTISPTRACQHGPKLHWYDIKVTPFLRFLVNLWCESSLLEVLSKAFEGIWCSWRWRLQLWTVVSPNEKALQFNPWFGGTIFGAYIPSKTWWTDIPETFLECCNTIVLPVSGVLLRNTILGMLQGRKNCDSDRRMETSWVWKFVQGTT